MDNKELETLANQLRFTAVDMVYRAKDGHPGPALSIADIMTVLYFDEMRLDPKNPDWEDRDRFILSKGHACPIWYACLSERGYFGEKVDDFHLRALHSAFQGHPTMQKTRGVDMTSGSLGNGIAVGCGFAIAAKYRKKDYRPFVVVGDGELQEGVCWEGINTASAHKLDNLFVFADRNGWQSGGAVVDTIGNNNLEDRFLAFGFDVQTINGHLIGEIKDAIAKAKTVKGKPHAIICDCIKGKGVSYMENNNAWHKGVPSGEQYAAAKKELLGGEE